VAPPPTRRRTGHADELRFGDGRVRERPVAPCIMRTVKHVLVVDDEPAIVEIVRDYLSDAGYRVSTAPSGDEA